MDKEYAGARIKLTLLYFGIIFFIVLLFSSIVAANQTRELDKFERLREFLVNHKFELPQQIYQQNLERLDETIRDIKISTTLNLVLLDALLLIPTSILSFYISGKTLEPIMKALHRQQQFVADASHEFRTPLASIKLEAEVLLRSKKTTNEEHREFLSSTIEEIDRLSNLTNNLLNLAKYDSHEEQELAKRSADIIEITNKVQKKLNKQMKLRKITYKFEKDKSKLIVAADPLELEELITILFDNAIKYNKDNGSIKIKIKKNKDIISFTIDDKGVGINKENMHKIFDRFFRESTDRSQKGFGLGLSIAKMICDKNNIDINVESEKDNGTRFVLKFRTVGKTHDS